MKEKLISILEEIRPEIDFEKETAKVLIDFLGNQTPMEIDLVALEKTF